MPVLDSPKILLITDDAAEESHATHILAKYHFTNLLVKLRRSADAMKFFLAYNSMDTSEPLPELIIMNIRDAGRINFSLALESRKGVLSAIPLILVVESRDEEEEIRKLTLPLSTCISRPIGFFKLLEGMQKLQMRWIVLRPETRTLPNKGRVIPDLRSGPA